MFDYEIIKGGANYLLYCLNVMDENDHILTAAERMTERFGPCGAVAIAPRKKDLITLCTANGWNLKK